MTVLTEPITLPDANFATMSLRARQVVSRTRSPFTLATRNYVHEGQMWAAEVTLPPKKREDAEAWIVLFAELSAGALRFHLGDPVGASPRGPWSGGAVVNGAGQTGQTLNVDGLTPSVTDIVLAGDYFQLGTGTEQRLYKVVEDASSNGAGEATLKFWPRLRESPSDGASLITANTAGTFELVDAFSWPWSAPDLTVIQFSATEAI